jgi:hypothetical protein
MHTYEPSWLGMDLDLWLKLLSLLGTALLWVLERRRKPRLHAFFIHATGHLLPGNPNPVHVNTHSLQVRNAGYAPALNVRVTHAFFPANTNIKVWPAVPYTTLPNPPNGNEMLFERLRPREQLSISYLYAGGPGGNTFDQFGTMVRFDEGTAEFFPIQHARLVPRWTRMLIYYLLSAGLVLTLYLLLKAAVFFFVLA